MNETILIFDRKAVRTHRQRALFLPAEHRFLIREVRRRLVERLGELSYRFERVLDLGWSGVADVGDLAEMLGEIGRYPEIVSVDGMAPWDARSLVAVIDEEALPFAPASFDLIVATLTLHWTNDLPGALIQIRRCLKPDGLFIAALWGGGTLPELREALMLAELETGDGAVTPRVSPFTDVRDAGALLQRAGFALPVVDADIVTATYAEPFMLMRDLRGMGETNAAVGRRRGLSRRALFARAADLYARRHAGAEGRIPASFEILTLTGWAPSPVQQQPLRPGAAKARLADALGTRERSAGEPAAPGSAPKAGPRASG